MKKLLAVLAVAVFASVSVATAGTTYSSGLMSTCFAGGGITAACPGGSKYDPGCKCLKNPEPGCTCTTGFPAGQLRCYVCCSVV